MGKKDKIQIAIPCGYNSEKYTKFLIDSIERTSSNEHDIEYLIGVNHAHVDLNLLASLMKSIELRHDYKIIVKEDRYTGNISTGHGQCVDMITPHMNSKYGMIVDSDCAFLSKNWDIKFSSLINKEYPIIGTEYGLGDNHYSGNANVIICFFYTDVMKEIGMSWVPEMKNITINADNTHIYNRKVGDEIFLDTGSLLPKKLYENNLKSFYMPLLSPRIAETCHMLKFMTDDMRGDEHQIAGQPICTHLGRSSSRCFETNPEAQLWKKRVIEWLQKV